MTCVRRALAWLACAHCVLFVLASSAQRDRPEFAQLVNPDASTTQTMLVICTPAEGCYSQRGDAMVCTGVDIFEKTVFLRTIAYPPRYDEYFVAQQFGLPSSFINAANFNAVLNNGNGQGNANGNANGNGNGNSNGNSNGSGEQPPDQQLGLGAFGAGAATARDARQLHFEPPLSVKQLAMRNGVGLGVGATPPGQAAPPPDPVCRIQLVAAFGNPFGVCCGPCRF